MLNDDQVLALMDQQGNKLAAALKALDTETALAILLQDPHPRRPLGHLLGKSAIGHQPEPFQVGKTGTKQAQMSKNVDFGGLD